jgi:hypothetical protein
MKIILKKVRQLRHPFEYIIFKAKISKEQAAEYCLKMQQEGLILAIKYLKDITGLGLKECKDLQDEFRYLLWKSNFDLGKSSLTERPTLEAFKERRELEDQGKT